jgi:hypothetical protein
MIFCFMDLSFHGTQLVVILSMRSSTATMIVHIVIHTVRFLLSKSLSDYLNLNIDFITAQISLFYKLIGLDIFPLIIHIFFLLLALGGFELFLYFFFQTTRGTNQS